MLLRIQQDQRRPDIKYINVQICAYLSKRIIITSQLTETNNYTIFVAIIKKGSNINNVLLSNRGHTGVVVPGLMF